jgi:hypothetical protein
VVLGLTVLLLVAYCRCGVVNPQAGCRVQAGLLELGTRLSCGSQFLIGYIASGIELCSGVEAVGQIAYSGGSVDAQT